MEEERVEQTNTKVSSIYVGESSRSIKERGGEHWNDFRNNNQKSHILKHQQIHHPHQEPKFVLRAVSFFKTALERQVGEAVRIRRRGGEGAVLNSKSEFDRCRIPRLIIEEQNLEKDSEMELQREQEVAEHLEREQRDWERRKTKERAEEHLEMMSRRLENRKKRKYKLVCEDWGEQNVMETNLNVIKEKENPQRTEEQVPVEQEGDRNEPSLELAPKNIKEQTENHFPKEQPKPSTPTPLSRARGRFGSRTPGRNSPIRTSLGLAKKTVRVPPPLAAPKSRKRQLSIKDMIEKFEELENDNRKGGGSPAAFPIPNKAPSVVKLEGDPPLGMERGALGVGTGPTPPKKVSTHLEITKPPNPHSPDNKMKEDRGSEVTTTLTPQLLENPEKVGSIIPSKPSPQIESPDVPPPPENKVCMFNKHGFCKTHRLLGFSREVTQSKWEDRGGGRGYGNVKRKVKKFICPARSKVPAGPSISTWINAANHKSAVKPTEEGIKNTPVIGHNNISAPESSRQPLRDI